jgi:hypothetical protein
MATTSRALTWGEQRYPIVLPSIRDPRLHVAAVIISIHVLGQVTLGFRVTIPQILAAMLTCAVIEVGITFWHSRAFVWPASAMLTGSGVALIMRTADTKVGDPWGTNDLGLFALVAGLGLLSKYVIKYRGTHVFNPSNIALVGAFIILGVEVVEPLDFWWGPLDAGLILAYAIILIGGTLVTRRLHLLPMAVTYWLTLAIGLGLLAGSGHCMTADWAFGPVCGRDFWLVIVTSPEVLIFLYFMLTDPKTVPSGQVARMAFALAVGIGSTLLIAPQTTEFGAKVGLLTSLAIMCAARPVFERLLPAPRSDEDQPRPFAERLMGIGTAGANAITTAARFGLAGVLIAVLGAGIVLAGTPARDIPAADGVVFLEETAQIDPASLPTVAIDPDVTAWNIERVRADAQGLALQLARNLAVERQALLERDGALLSAVDHGDRLAEMTTRLDGAGASGDTEIARYDFDELFLTVRQLATQSGLGMAFESTGTATVETYAADGSLRSTREEPFDLTFVLRQALGDERWFVVGVLPTE